MGLVKKRERKDLEKPITPTEKQENQTENKPDVVAEKELKHEN